MAEVTLADATRNIESSNAKDRKQGLADLKHVLRFNQNNAHVKGLSNRSCLKVYQAIFQVAVDGRSALVNAKTPTLKVTTENHLFEVASALRLSVEAGLKILLLKSVLALRNHIVETIYLSAGDFCEPLALEYMKCLRTIFTFQPHVEQLASASEWEATMSFCLDCLKKVEAETMDEHGEIDVATSSGQTNRTSYRSSARSFARESAASQGPRSKTKMVAEQVIACLRLMTAAPNAPLKQQARSILWTLIEHLKASSNINPSIPDAFTAINNVLAWSRTEQIELTQEVTSHLVRLVRQMWFSRSKALSEMLTTLWLLQPYITRAMRRQAAISLRTDLVGLAQAIQSVYEQDNSNTKQLGLDDIRLEIDPAQHREDGQVSSPLFTLKCNGARAESNWILVHVLKSIYRLLNASRQDGKLAENYQESINGDENVDPNPRSKKRQRQQDEFLSLVETIITGTPNAKICALQVVAFLAQEIPMSTSQLTKTLEALSVSCVDEHGTVVSWSFLALASCACQASATGAKFVLHWTSAWQIATRSLSNASSCRAASYALYIMMQLRLIPQASISELLQVATDTLDLSGPALLSDAVSLLLRGLLKASHQLSPEVASRTAESIIGWLSHVFTPSRLQEQDRAYVMASSTYDPCDVTWLVAMCLGQELHTSGMIGLQVWEGPAQTWLLCRAQDELVSYLILRPADSEAINPALTDASVLVPALGAPARVSCEAQLLTHLISETTRINETWKSLTRPGIDTWIMLCKACCIVNCMASCVTFKDTRRHHHLQKQSEALTAALCDYLVNPSCEDAKLDILLSIFSKSLTGLARRELGLEFRPTDCETLLCSRISVALSQRQNARHDNDGVDAMDIDDDFGSQESGASKVTAQSTGTTNDMDLAFSRATLRSSLALYANVVNAVTAERVSMQGSGVQAAAVVSDYICDQSQSFVVSCRDVLSSLPGLGLELSAQETEKILSYLFETKSAFINNYSYARSEVVIGTILDFLSSQSNVWTDQANRTLYNLGLDIYEWCTELLGEGSLSANVQKRISRLLLELCHVNPDYTANTDSSADSPMRSILTLLEQGSITLMFHLSKRISEVFGIFVLAKHAAIFEDIVEKLPDNADWLEGIAMRLLILSNLASAWHSLLRYCVYYMFETAGRVKTSLEHATHCVEQLSMRLPLKSPQKLFSAFAPQLLHTYIDTQQPLARLPFAAFQYTSLGDLLRVNESEVCAQLVTRGCLDGLDTMTKHMKLLHGDLIRRSFAKCMAYTLGRDVSKSDGKPDIENRLRTLIDGKGEAKAMIIERWPTIIGYLYLSLRQDDPEDSWMTVHSGYTTAARALSEMKSYSYSSRNLPECQQPSFPSKNFFHETERLNRRLGSESTPWTSSAFTLVARMLLDAIDESLGSLHACLMVRRMRILISMAGEVAYQGFALEMLLHSLRPFVSDTECADDALGMIQYLLNHGREYLSNNLEFLRGIIILLVLQVRRHARLKRDRSTQESQHTATVQKMYGFQKWLVRYLDQTIGHGGTLSDGVLKEKLLHIQLPGNARRDTPESFLLLFLLDQWRPDSSVCSKADSTEAFEIFSENFEAPPLVSVDCLGDDEAAVRFSDPIWQVVRSAPLPEAFTTWAAQVLGRAYASNGRRPQNLARRSTVAEEMVRQASSEGNIVAESQAKIAKCTGELLFSRSRTEAGLAEYCLRRLYEMQGAEVDETLAFEQMLPEVVIDAVREATFHYVPALATQLAPIAAEMPPLRQSLRDVYANSTEEWTTTIAVNMCGRASDVPHVAALGPLIQHVRGLASELLPSMIHLLLTREVDRSTTLRTELSTFFSECLSETDAAFYPKQQFILELLLYLRSQPLPNENTKVDRHRWLDIDYLLAADAGSRCGMPTSALLLAESVSSPAPATRQSGKRASTRTSLTQAPNLEVPHSLLLAIYKQVEEPDSFYGVQQAANLESVLDRLDHERDGFRSLMFRSAQLDSHMRNSGNRNNEDTIGMIRSLSDLNFNGLALALLNQGVGSSAQSTEAMLKAAQTLQQWDINPPEEKGAKLPVTFLAFQDLGRSSNVQDVHTRMQSHLTAHTKQALDLRTTSVPAHSWYGALASLAEVCEVLSSVDQQELDTRYDIMQSRMQWMQLARFDDVKPILTGRQTLFGVLRRNESLRNLLHFDVRQCHGLEARALLSGSRLAREHARLQEALAATTSVSDLMKHYEAIDLHVSAAVKLETASVLWEAGELSASVRMLRDTLDITNLEKQDVAVGRSGLEAQLAYQLANARLEKPEEILSNYLKPAIGHLKNRKAGREAGKVFYEFAAFCDHELQSPSNIENFNRIIKLRQGKEDEVEAIKLAMRNSKKVVGDREDLRKSLTKAQAWLDIDKMEEKGLRDARNHYIHQSLRNYLLALGASDDHDICVLRFFALWLENAEDDEANGIALKYLSDVPSWKFVLLMNQLISRAEEQPSTFQTALQRLLVRICAQHPHHSAHHLFAASRRPNNADPASNSRYSAAKAVYTEVCTDSKSKELIGERIFKADALSKAFAELKPVLPERHSKFSANQFKESKSVVEQMPRLRLPPITMSIALRPSGDYQDVPIVQRYEQRCSVMNGNSAPKLATCLASDGVQYKQLFKSGDDLRQDAIMEQVFEEVSKMLRNHRATRQRDLKVRTYKVVPLSAKSGIIEFVPNSIPLNDFLRPAHRSYHPQDWTDTKVREMIHHAYQSGNQEQRVKEYQKVCQHLHPVLRHFFFERYDDPDDWFQKRTAYTRTTASISILGHVLGLGDRHNSNIMLDTATGEVVHIDLGVAFEAGRILPIPELVPFRLTRDIVDGMGSTKTEGVFRRCCEFTLDAVREDKDSIMTLLNVLRYDPLYSWTVSPLRAKKMQEALETGHSRRINDDTPSRKREEEAGEADRALSIVEKKLSKTLSTAAAVNELIQAATDEKNLATLFHGWAAWF
ncbi:serine threonine- kinase tel1 [Lecanosticta acicola]|uniref:Serine/threonine-protein kinase Tel1 n=1 Tax=Lecanosticta acicola TaxID=111012 RepID=A0AAI8YTN4_9PEZI|nr:serine threonine- kinase tel1 [Lecanosticta acicola]